MPKCHIFKFTTYKDSCLYTIKGFVYTAPESKNSRTSFIFKTKEIESAYFKQECCGYVLVRAKRKRNFRFAEELILTGNLYRPYGFAKGRQRSFRDYLASKGIFAIMQVKSSRRTGKLSQASAFRGFTLWLKEKTEKVFFQYLPALPASVLDAMVLGEKRNIPPLIYNSMIKSGTVHILVVSGFNVGIIAFIVSLFLKLMRIPRQLRFFIAGPLIIIYCFVTGASTPVVRATVMAIFFMFGILLKKVPDIYNSCALAAIFILGLCPSQLFDVGFQLSFASVISIVYIYPKIKSLLGLGKVRARILKFLIDGCLVSFSAWLGTAGFIAYYFRLFTPITVLANLFIVPLAALVTLCGICLAVASILSSPLASFYASSSELVVILLLKLNAALIKIPYAYFHLP